MVAKSGKHKAKKSRVEASLETREQEEAEIDLSHLRKPITTSVLGLKQILQLLKTGTDEVKSYITYECEILFECRLCRTIFRSLANFILHKRSYCVKKFSISDMPDCQNPGIVLVENEISSDNDEIASMESDTKKCTNKSISPVIEKLVQKQEISKHVKTVLNEDLTLKTESNPVDASQEKRILLQKIDTSHAAVFQTFTAASQQLEDPNLMKTEVMEIHGIFEPNEAVLGSDGKICDFKSNETLNQSIVVKHDLVCTECNAKFATKKTLTSHIKYKHNKTCVVFPCPDCKDPFANPWSVYRHLYKVHRLTSAQVKKMRHQIHSGAIQREQQEILKKSDPQLDPEETNEENQWMSNFEDDNDLQMCGGCGKRFERKAALHSHSQMCSKRIEIQNTISKAKLSNVKNKIVEDAKIDQRSILKGAAKRKFRIFESFKIQPTETSNKKRFKEVDKNTVFEGNLETNDAGTLVKITNSTNSIDIDIKTIDYTTKEKNETKVKEKLVKLPEVGPEISVYIKSNDIDEPSKENDLNTEVVAQPEELILPVCSSDEIYNISDDSCEFVEETDVSKPQEISCHSSSSGKGPLRKRAASCDETVDVKQHNDNESFIMKASPYMEKNKLKCLSCQTIYASLYQLLWHMSVHFSWFRFQCTKCPFMSFNKYDCTTHAFKFHGTPNNLIESTVLPIPKWKIINMSHDFTALDNNVLMNRNLPKAITAIGENSRNGLRCKEENLGFTENSEFDFSYSKTKCLQTSLLEKKTKPVVKCGVEDIPDTILVIDDELETSKIFGDKKKETVIQLNEVKSIESDVRNEKKLQPGPSRLSDGSNRPIRNRTKSVKTLQSDFLYDLTKVLKLNDNSIKSSSHRSKKNVKKGTSG